MVYLSKLKNRLSFCLNLFDEQWAIEALYLTILTLSVIDTKFILK